MTHKRALMMFAKKVDQCIAQKELFRNAVLFIVVFNFIATTIFPLLLILLGNADKPSHNPYITLIWGGLLVGILIYATNKKTIGRKYFDIVPSLLISVYFVTVIAVFIVKTISIPLVVYIASYMSTDAESAQRYMWALLGVVLHIWQILYLFVFCRKVLIVRIPGGHGYDSAGGKE